MEKVLKVLQCFVFRIRVAGAGGRRDAGGGRGRRLDRDPFGPPRKPEDI